MPQAVDYGDFAAALIDRLGPSPLDAGAANAEVARELAQATDADLFMRPIVDAETARCCWSGLWLRANELDRSHQISQSVHTAEGSYWHALMHRREGDYSNSLYWFRRVGEHPIFAALASGVGEIEAECGVASFAADLAPHGAWNPEALGNLCRQGLRSNGDAARFAVAVQEAEWRLLFGFCYSRAIGA